MILTKQQFVSAMPGCVSRINKFWPHVQDAMTRAGITEPKDIAAFIATIGHESLDFRYMEELASGAAYQGRADLGDTAPGSGVLYKGRGPIQITGLYNYQKFSAWSGYDAVNQPQLLTDPFIGCLSAGWFWTVNGLSAIANTGDFLRVSIRVNGRNRVTGLPNNWDDRKARFQTACSVLLPQLQEAA